MGPDGTAPAGATTLVQNNPNLTAPSGGAATSNIIPAGPTYRGAMTLADGVAAGAKIAQASGQGLVSTRELAIDDVGRLGTNVQLNLNQMKLLYPGMEPHTGSPLPPFMHGSEDLTPQREGEALKLGNTLYIRYEHNLWKAPVRPDSVWLERMDENGVGVVHRTAKDIVNVGETATLLKIAQEKGVVLLVACVETSAVDKNAREAAANIRGLDPNATWDDIKKFDAVKKIQLSALESAREVAASERGLNPNAAWDDIKKFDADKKQAQLVAAAAAAARDRAQLAEAAKRAGLPFTDHLTWRDVIKREAEIERDRLERERMEPGG